MSNARQIIYAALASAGMIACLAAIAVGASLAHGVSIPRGASHDPRTCFPRDLWNGGNVPPSLRPCATIARVYEDGSVRVRVSDASGVVRYSYGVGAQDR